MADIAAQEVTRLLSAAGRGDPVAAEQVFPLIYDELRRLAQRYMNQERADHTLQATALVNEAYVKLVRTAGDESSWNSRSHFFAAAALAMRRILVNHARARQTQKRGGDRQRMILDEAAAAFNDRAIDLLDLDDALTRLAALDQTQARIVELRFFGGLTVEQTAGILDKSVRTIQYDWAMARAWLRGELLGPDAAS